MKVTSIIFSAPMIVAALAGTKTMTRRIAPITDLNIKPHSNDVVTWGVSFAKPMKGVLACHSGGKVSGLQARSIIASEFCPYGKAGDQLWARESYFAWGRWGVRYSAKKSRNESYFVDMTLESGKTYAYAADGLPSGYEKKHGVRGDKPQWWKRPAIFMPKAACRLRLEITAVRVERLQDMSDDDAWSEGISFEDYTSFGGCLDAPKAAYSALWDAINGPGSWSGNPWVWVIEFKTNLSISNVKEQS